MNAFWFVTLTILLLRWYIKRLRYEMQFDVPRKSKRVPEDVVEVKVDKPAEETEEERAYRKQRQKDEADLRRQGYTDELIAVILPTINNE